MKTCLKCKIEKPISEFNKNRTRKDGLEQYCKYCIKKRQKEYRKANKERIKEKKRVNIEDLKDPYVRVALHYHGINASDATPEIIQLKREQIQMHRLIKKLKKEVCHGAN